MKALLVFSLLFAYALAGTDSGKASEDAGKELKEKNYPKFVNEKVYSLPFHVYTTSPLQEGKTIHFLGKIKADPKRIHIDFRKGSSVDATADLPMHLSFRWDEGIFSGKIIYNTRTNNVFGPREQRLKNPFKANGDFDLRIRILAGKFEIYGNHEYMGSFKALQDLSEVGSIYVEGNLTSLNLFHYTGMVFSMPYTGKVALVPGKRIDIAVLPKGDRVVVEIYNRALDCPLHLSIRFDEGVIVRNSMINNKWGVEERNGKLTISNKRIFDLTIIAEDTAYLIFLNGERFGSYAHRTSPKKNDVLKIDGKAEVHWAYESDASAK